jgi:hypothetical protein
MHKIGKVIIQPEVGVLKENEGHVMGHVVWEADLAV